MGIDAKKLKQELTTEHIIKIVRSLGGNTYDNNKSNEIIFYSCCHHLDAQSHKAKLYYYKDSKSFRCYTCSSTFDIISLVEARWNLENRKFSFTEVLYYIAELVGIEADKLQRHTLLDKSEMPWEQILEKYARIRGGEIPLTTYNKNLLNFFTKRVPYDWLKEGISFKTMELYGIGYYGFRNQTIIPCFDEKNNLVGIRVRNWNPTQDRKYDTFKSLDGTDHKFPTNQVLYGFNFNQFAIERKKEVWIVESEKAVMKSDTWFGNDSVTVGVFGISGWDLNKKRRDMLLNTGISKVVIFPDYDYKDTMSIEYFQFCNRQIKLANKFKGFCEVEIVINVKNTVKFKDNAFDVEKDVFKKLCRGATDLGQFIKNRNKDKEIFESGAVY